MKIQEIKISNFRAFYGEYNIPVKGKNLLIYGENGSGKSSFFNAIQDFFLSSIKGIEDLPFTENKWNTEVINADVEEKQIAITFDTREQPFHYNIQKPADDITSIRYIGELNPFYTYRRLLKTYLINKGELEKNLFILFIEDIIANYRDVNGKTLISTWEEFTSLMDYKGRIESDAEDVQAYLDTFNTELKLIFSRIVDTTNYFLETYFKNGIVLEIAPPEFKSEAIHVQELRDEVEQQVSDARIELSLKFLGKEIKDYQYFLNEARLSALAISFYLASIHKDVLPVIEEAKIMFLDDVFIGLDTSNRKPLLKIIEKEFNDWQIFITTYDRHWFEIAKYSLPSWDKAEIYTGKIEGAEYEKPIYIANSDIYIEKAHKYFNKANNSKDFIDYPAAGNYLRKACENSIKSRLYGKYKYKVNGSTDEVNLREEITELFESLKRMLDDLELDSSILNDYPKVIKSVLNPLSHDNLDKPIYKSEVEDAFDLYSKIENIKLQILLKQDEEIKIEVGSRQLFFKLKTSDFILFKQNGQIALSELVLQPRYMIQNGQQRSQRMYKQTSLKKVYNSVHYAESGTENAFDNCPDIYAEFLDIKTGNTLRQLIDNNE